MIFNLSIKIDKYKIYISQYKYIHLIFLFLIEYNLYVFNNNKKMNIILSKISEDKFENDNSSDSEIGLNGKNMKKFKEKITENKKGNLLGRAKTMKDKSETKN